MAEIKTYQPSIDLPAANRNRAGYYAAVKKIISSLADDISEYCTVVYDDTNYRITFTPTAENINDHHIAWEVTSADWLQVGDYIGSGSIGNLSSQQFNSDPKMYFYFGNNAFFMGMGATVFACGIITTTSYDGIITPMYFDRNMHFYASNSNAKLSFTSAQHRDNNTSTKFCIKPFTFGSLGLVGNDVFYYDGGAGTIPTQTVFSINADSYICILYNILFRL